MLEDIYSISVRVATITQVAVHAAAILIFMSLSCNLVFCLLSILCISGLQLITGNGIP